MSDDDLRLALPDGRILRPGAIHLVEPELVEALAAGETGRLDDRPLAEVAERMSWCRRELLEDPGTLREKLDLSTVGGEADPDMAEDLLRATDLERLLDGGTWYLSTGEGAIAALAVATARPFDLLVAADPLAGVDKLRRETATEWLEAVAQDHLVVLGEPRR